MAATTNNAPAQLQPGAYWYIAAGETPVICEKRAGEDFVRFTNGSRRSWVQEHDRFVGPLPEPRSSAVDPTDTQNRFVTDGEEQRK